MDSGRHRSVLVPQTKFLNHMGRRIFILSYVEYESFPTLKVPETILWIISDFKSSSDNFLLCIELVISKA